MADESKEVVDKNAFSKEEMENVSKDLQATLEKYNAIFHIHRTIAQDGTIQAELQIVKKSALVPKEEGVVSPIQADDLKNGGNNKEETEEKPDAAAA